MSTGSYLPPQAALGDGNLAQGAESIVTSVYGRIGRLRLIAYTGAAAVLAVAVLLVVSLVMGGSIMAMTSVMSGDNPAATGASITAFVVMYLGTMVLFSALFIFMIFKLVQRNSDIGWPSWAIAFAVLPLAGLVWMIVPGSANANRFGAPPPPNSTGVKVLSTIFIVLGVVFTSLMVAAMFNAASFFSQFQR
jgi:uncharacterized membrane protein YhaH (DUF805 family)